MKAQRQPRKGKGIIQDVRKKFVKTKKNLVDTFVNTADQVKDKVVSAVDQVKDKVDATVKTAKAVYYGPSELSASVREILAKHGDHVITKASIVRTPVSSAVKEALNVVSLGEFKKKLAKQSYDDIFHLFMVLTMSDGTVSLEKNSIITMRENPNRKGESVEATPPEGLTVNDLMNNAAKKMGKKFIPYAANSNNCQNFILNVLRANNMDTPENEMFVKQDTNELFEGGFVDLRKFSNAITDLGAKIATVQEGGEIAVTPKKQNAWIQHCKDEAARRGISYREALRSPETKETYKK